MEEREEDGEEENDDEDDEDDEDEDDQKKKACGEDHLKLEKEIDEELMVQRVKKLLRGEEDEECLVGLLLLTRLHHSNPCIARALLKNVNALFIRRLLLTPKLLAARADPETTSEDEIALSSLFPVLAIEVLGVIEGIDPGGTIQKDAAAELLQVVQTPSHYSLDTRIRALQLLHSLCNSANASSLVPTIIDPLSSLFAHE